MSTEKEPLKLKFDGKLVTVNEFLRAIDNQEQIAMMNNLIKLMGEHLEPKMTYREIVQLPLRDFFPNYLAFMKEQGMEAKYDFLAKSQKD